MGARAQWIERVLTNFVQHVRSRRTPIGRRLQAVDGTRRF
jgi:hypothetical protein